MTYMQHNILGMLYIVREYLSEYFAKEDKEAKETPGRGRVMLSPSSLLIEKALFQTEKAIQTARQMGKALAKTKQRTLLRSRVSLGLAWRQVLRDIEKEKPVWFYQMITRIPKHLPLIRCERSDFKEILYILIRNALDAMRPFDKLILRAGLGLNEKGEPMVMMTLADTGQGIPQSELSNLFQPFYTTKKEGKGNGFGLYLAKELANKNGGDIRVTSFEGEGTTFHLRFPVDGKSIPNF